LVGRSSLFFNFYNDCLRQETPLTDYSDTDLVILVGASHAAAEI